jgi:hypothetical protein
MRRTVEGNRIGYVERSLLRGVEGFVENNTLCNIDFDTIRYEYLVMTL